MELSTRQKPLQRIIQGNVRQNRTFSLWTQHWRVVPVVLSVPCFFSVCAHFKPPQGTIPSGHFSCKSFYDQLKFPNRKCSFLHSQIWKKFSLLAINIFHYTIWSIPLPKFCMAYMQLWRCSLETLLQNIFHFCIWFLKSSERKSYFIIEHITELVFHQMACQCVF